MDAHAILTLGHHLLAAHGLAARGWQFALDDARLRAGACFYDRKTVRVSRHLAGRSEAEVRNIVLHEVAHALVGPEARPQHGAAWRAQALAIGCDGARCHALGPLCPAPYRVTCGCGAVDVLRFRLQGLKGKVCKRCASPLTILCV
jgi:predicted SprT family Zn-dependent metalloprotease